MQKFSLAALVAVALTFYLLFVHAPPGPRSVRLFDPARTADLELRMWQAYYGKEKLYLFTLLVTMLHEQYRYPWGKAVSAGYHLARAATTFAEARSGYERVLPDLERAYEIARNWTNAAFDPKTVARAELAWWVARRTAGENSVENVGERIADEYALFYQLPRASVMDAALLRARAAALRDTGGEHADWSTIANLLRRSYQSLHDALSSP